MLRPALVLAFDVALAGVVAVPPVEPPRRLRPFLGFTKLPDQALAAVRRALDEDDAFRVRVEGLADEAELGRAGWLFVVRPEGWEDELAGLGERARTEAASASDEKEERTARKRLAKVEEAARRAEQAATRARADADKATAELAGERSRRRQAEEEVAKLARRVTSLEGERDSARRKAEAAAGDAARLAEVVEGLRTEAATQAAEADVLRAAVVPAPAARTAVAAAPAEPVGVPADVEGAAQAVAAAAAAAGALGRALAAAARALSPPSASASASASPSASGAGEDGGAPAPAPPTRPPRSPPRPRRRPASLPPAVLDDTAEAAVHLVRVPDMFVVVDGYNAAKLLWPDETPLELRERLLDALGELQARTGADIHAVFDGADLGGPLARPSSPRRVRFSFSPADVEADDVVLALVDATPVHRPVVVATSDRRVQDGARARGANVITSAQLAAVLGRA